MGGNAGNGTSIAHKLFPGIKHKSLQRDPYSLEAFYTNFRTTSLNIRQLRRRAYSAITIAL
jgi:hypothetical protein